MGTCLICFGNEDFTEGSTTYPVVLRHFKRSNYNPKSKLIIKKRGGSIISNMVKVNSDGSALDIIKQLVAGGIAGSMAKVP